MDLGLLILRVVVGVIIAGHGAQKMFGWYGGPGLDNASGFMENLGYKPGRSYATLAAFVELAVGVMFVVGFLMPVAAAALVGQMINAIFAAHRDKGLWNTSGGYEYPLVLGAIGAAFCFTTAGAVSLDNGFGFNFESALWGLLALAIGVAVGAATLTVRETEEDEEVIDLRDDRVVAGRADAEPVANQERQEREEAATSAS